MSQEPSPQIDLLETLTNRKLLQSLGSDCCPACSRTKRLRQTFCPSCYRKLPPGLRTALYRGIDDGYLQAVVASLKALKCRRFIMPGDGADPIAQLSALGAPLPERTLRRSLDSNICPKCAGGKQPNQCLCIECRTNLIAHCAAESTLFETATVADSLTPALLSKEPVKYNLLMVQAIRKLKGNVFHFPQE